MKKLLLVMVGLILVAGMVLGCLGCNGNGSQFVKYGTLQGKIMDAVTGEAIGGDDLEIYLIQGKETRKPSKLVKNMDNDLVGEYVFDKIPVQLYNYYTDDAIFKIVVIKEGYQRFESTDVCFTTTFAARDIGDGVETDLWITNEVINQIGNIYLYPLGTTAGDVTVYVYDPQGTPIDGANVLLRQNVYNNSTVSYTSDRLWPTGGLYPSLTDTTDSNGKATFSGDDLTLGGSYSTVVEALTNDDGEQLATATSASFIIGIDNTTRVVNMGVVTGTQVLYVTSVSNQFSGTITPAGTLTITFNQPIIVDTTLFTATVTDGVLASAIVNAELSNSDMTLTLRPTFTTDPTAKGATITYTYGGGAIILKNSQTSSGRTLNGSGNDVRNIYTNQAVSRTVLMISN